MLINEIIRVTLERATGKIPNHLESDRVKEIDKIKKEIIDLNSKKEEAEINWQAKIFSKVFLILISLIFIQLSLKYFRENT